MKEQKKKKKKSNSRFRQDGKNFETLVSNQLLALRSLAFFFFFENK